MYYFVSCVPTVSPMTKPEKLPKKLTEHSINELPIADTRYDVRDHVIGNLYLTVYPSGKKTWVYRYRFPVDGKLKSKRYRIGSDTIRPAAARSTAKSIAGDIAKGIDPNAEKQLSRRRDKRFKEGTLRAFLDNRYEPWATVETKSGAQTIQTIKSAYEFLLDRPMESFTHWELDKWRRTRHKDGISPSTTNRQIAALRGCLSRAVTWKVIDEHPLRDFKLSKTDKAKKPRVLLDDQETALRNALRARDLKMRDERISANKWRNDRHIEIFPDYGHYVDHLEPMVLLALNTGMRRGEILHLRWTDVLPDTVTVRGENAKSSQTREIPLNLEAKEILEKWDSNSEWVFPGIDESPLTTIKRSWAGIKSDAGLPELRFHDLRHTFATRILQRGTDIETVRDLLGHADVATTAKYLHATDESKKKAVNLI